jgi:hypothetical protein
LAIVMFVAFHAVAENEYFAGEAARMQKEMEELRKSLAAATAGHVPWKPSHPARRWGEALLPHNVERHITRTSTVPDVSDDVFVAAEVKPLSAAAMTCDDVKVLTLPCTLLEDDAFTVVLRKDVRDFVDVMLVHLMLPEGHHGFGPAVLATGGPGIGKTHAVTVAVVLGLMAGRRAGPAPKTIIIDRRREGCVVKLELVVEDGVAVSIASAVPVEVPLERFVSRINELRDPTTVYIVNPCSGNTGQHIANVCARTV